MIIKKTIRKQNRRASSLKQRKQQHLLDVKVRAKKAAARRTQRLLFGFCMVVLVGSLLGGIAFGAKTILNALFFSNPDYAVKTIEVNTDGNLSRETILKVANVSEGANLFSISLPRIQERLNVLPQVEESNVQRDLPNKLTITIQERRPVALVVPPDKNTGSVNFENAYLIDHRGILLKPKALAPEYYGLPVIVGVDVSNYLPGQALDQDEVKAALELIRVSSEILPSRLQIQSIDVSKGYCLVVTDKQRASITFSTDQIEGQLRKLESVLNYCDHNNKELQTVNLMAQRNIPATFLESGDGTDPANPSVKVANPVPLPAPENPAQLPAEKASGRKETKKEQRRSRNSRESKHPRVRKAIPLEKFRLNG